MDLTLILACKLILSRTDALHCESLLVMLICLYLADGGELDAAALSSDNGRIAAPGFPGSCNSV